MEKFDKKCNREMSIKFPTEVSALINLGYKPAGAKMLIENYNFM